MHSTKGTQRNWTIHTGRHVRNFLENYEVSKEELARRMDIPIEIVDDILVGGNITEDIAKRLAEATGFPYTFWIGSEKDYQNDLARLTPKTAGEMKNLDGFLKLRGSAAEVFRGLYTQHLADEEMFERADLMKNAVDYTIFVELFGDSVYTHVNINSGIGIYVAFGPKIMELYVNTYQHELMSRERVAPFFDRPFVMAG